jgi:hypothetical protein
MSFDQFNSDETLTLRYCDENGRKASAITIADRDHTRDIYDLVLQRDSINQMTDSTARSAALASLFGSRNGVPLAATRSIWGETAARRRCSTCTIPTAGPTPAQGGFAGCREPGIPGRAG